MFQLQKTRKMTKCFLNNKAEMCASDLEKLRLLSYLCMT